MALSKGANIDEVKVPEPKLAQRNNVGKRYSPVPSYFVTLERDTWLVRLDAGSMTACAQWMPDQVCPEPVEGSGMTIAAD